MSILITGVGGFIGFHTATFFLKKKFKIIGIDNLNNYYDVKLKNARLNQLRKFENFTFLKKDIQDKKIFKDLKKERINCIVNLAAQAGVRHSLKDPYTYINSNILGHLNLLELAREFDISKFIYASSSSVYGGNKVFPFSVNQRVDNPISLYAASKKSTELISECYSHLFNIQCIGLRFFTVYGPWGRPDMATFIFTKKIIEKSPIDIFNYGKMERDFTYIDDIVSGIYGSYKIKKKFKHKIYNLGNNNPEVLIDFINLIEKTLGIKAKKNLLPIQPGDVKKTFANIKESKKDLDFNPKTKISEGIPKFINWYKKYFKI
ncbi:MAG: UDP-N-acetylglucosamine 4-epimerase [Alphaproteobacteria bacterium MarineAlpha8_Bin1]|nr:MAG: UDP-N-acetylglucosamine 4-epimerase [Alphaproteobacteria bacterium MarineAlpha8_Bin1]|tara:strand:- start:874 stop:1830 length:957 start_codon:yes stop_codon:yes gene_type:complete